MPQEKDKIYENEEIEDIPIIPEVPIQGGTPAHDHDGFGSELLNIASMPSGVTQIFFQATAPTIGVRKNDYWIDSDDNKIYRYSGTAWGEVQDDGINTAITNAATAQSTADGKIYVYRQTTAPSGLGAGDVGDLWLDSDDSDKVYRWSGSAWVAAAYDVAAWSKIVDDDSNKPDNNADVTSAHTAAAIAGQGALATLDEITETEITNDAVTSPKINVTDLAAINANLGTITAGSIYSGLFSTASSAGGEQQRIVLNTADDTLRYYNSAGEQLLNIGVTGIYTANILRTGTTSVATLFSDLDGNDTNTAPLVQFQILGIASTGSVIYADHKGLGYALEAVASSNASRVKATARFGAVSGQGANISLQPIANAPQTPAEGDIYANANHHPYYYNGSEQRILDIDILGIFAYSSYGGSGPSDITVSSNTSMTGDWHCDNLTINNGITLNTNGWRLFVRGTLTNNGTIQFTVNNGGNGSNGSGSSGGAGGNGGAAKSEGSLSGTEDGKAGTAGGNGSAASNANCTQSAAGTAGDAVAKSIGEAGRAGYPGGAGGNGMFSNGCSAGVAGAAGGQTGTVYNDPKSLVPAYILRDGNDKFTGASGTGGSTGGGGGGSSNSASGGGGGGAGGAGGAGGIVCLFVNNLVNNGTIKALGGNGGNGGNGADGGGTDAGGGAGGAGGSGGSGGKVILVYRTKSGAGTITSPGGTGGTGGTGGAGIGNGNNGGAGNVGLTGITGNVIEIAI